LRSKQWAWYFKFKVWVPIIGVGSLNLLEYSFVDKENEEIPL